MAFKMCSFFLWMCSYKLCLDVNVLTNLWRLKTCFRCPSKKINYVHLNAHLSHLNVPCALGAHLWQLISIRCGLNPSSLLTSSNKIKVNLYIFSTLKNSKLSFHIHYLCKLMVFLQFVKLTIWILDIWETWMNGPYFASFKSTAFIISYTFFW
jgi:hypothetical protein